LTSKDYTCQAFFYPQNCGEIVQRKIKDLKKQLKTNQLPALGIFCAGIFTDKIISVSFLIHFY